MSGCRTPAAWRCAARSGRGRPGVPCLMLTSFSDDEALFDAIMAGAAGYVLKEVRASALVTSIRRVAAGESLLDPAIVARVLENLKSTRVTGPSELLTPQESRILELLAEGMTNRQIADAMYLSEKTIKNYVSNLLGKLGMNRRTEAAVYAVRLKADGERTWPQAGTPKWSDGL